MGCAFMWIDNEMQYAEDQKVASAIPDLEKPMDYSQLYTSAGALHARHVGMIRDHLRPVHLVHLINPVAAPDGHPLARAQAVTYESMRRAAACAADLDLNIRVDLVAAPLPEDTEAVPHGFIRLPALAKTSADVGTFQVERRLPLLCEVITRGHSFATSTAADAAAHLIFTNVDIGLLPHFYTYVAWLIRSGHDVAIINRRSVTDSYGGPEDLPAMLSDFGHIHPGLDCFIFEARMAEQFVPFNTIIGMAHVMRPLFFNLMAFARDPVVLTDAHATFHLGDDSDWGAPKYADYDRFNRSECLKVIAALCALDPKLESRLTAFVNATEEHKWIPEGILGVRKIKRSPPFSVRIRRRLIRLLDTGR